MNPLPSRGDARCDPTNIWPAVTGVGLVTPLANNAPDTWQALLDGRYITGHTFSAARTIPGGAARLFGIATMAADEAMREAGWKRDIRCGHDDTALVVGTSKGPIDSWLAGTSTPRAGGSSAGLVDPAGVGQLAQKLASELKLGEGPRLTLSAACASGLHALIRAVMLLREKRVRRVLVVAAESSFHPVLIACYRRLGVLAPDGVGCRPFDHGRSGFLLSEAAAAICLEANPGNTQTERTVIDAFALGGDASHLTGADPYAATLRAVIARLIEHGPPDFIHGHGTGTPANDLVELGAIEACLLERRMPFASLLYSHKGALGHSLGAAGLVAVAINCLAHRHGIVPGNIRTTDPLLAKEVKISPAAVERRVRRSIALAAGFGGAVAGVSLATFPG